MRAVTQITIKQNSTRESYVHVKFTPFFVYVWRFLHTCSTSPRQPVTEGVCVFREMFGLLCFFGTFGAFGGRKFPTIKK